MKTIDLPEKTLDPVITEVRAIKREMVAEHGGDLDSFFAAIRQRQTLNPRLVKSTVAQLASITSTETDVSKNPSPSVE